MTKGSIVFCFAVFSCLLQTALGNSFEGIVLQSWSEWVTEIIWKGIYFILISLITLCVISTAIKNKFGAITNRYTVDDNDSDETWMKSVCRAASGGPHPIMMATSSQSVLSLRKIFYNKGDFQSSQEDLRIRDQLKEKEEAVTWLREELEISNKAREELEETVGCLDKDKTDVEDCLQSTTYQGLLEMEKLKRETSQTKRQLQQALKERDNLSQEVEILQRESRIVSSALRDNQAMEMRLEEARKEIAQLKKQLENIKNEKVSVARLVQKIATSATDDRGDGITLPVGIETAVSSNLEQDLGSEVLESDQELAHRFLAEIAKTNLTEIKEEKEDYTEEEINNFFQEDQVILKRPPLQMQSDHQLDQNGEEIGEEIHGDCIESTNLGRPGVLLQDYLLVKGLENDKTEEGQEEEEEEEKGEEETLFEEVDEDEEEYVEGEVDETEECYEEDYEYDDDSNLRLVTGSEAFKKFLEKNPIFPSTDE